MPESVYPISVVVPTMRGWPTMRISLDAVLPQVRRAGGQLVVADGSGRPQPDDYSGSDISWLSMPGATVFELRQAAYRTASAPVIAITEDHCSPTEDWVESVIGGHRDHPRAAMIFGSVENGSTSHLIDWALYCAGYIDWAPPLTADATGNPGHANVSWKRWAFERVPPHGDRVLEFRMSAALRDAGEEVRGDPRLNVRHHQCDPIVPTATVLFHNGRAIAGIRRSSMGLGDWARLGAPVLVAGYRTLRTLSRALAKPGVRGPAFRSAPLIWLLHAVHAAGECVGYVAGPGDSPRKLH